MEKAWEVAGEIVVAIGLRDDPSLYEGILPKGVRVVRDEIEGVGPLAGMQSGLREVASEYTFILPCDSPFLNPEALRYIAERGSRVDAAIPKWPNGFIEPLHSIYRVSPTLSATEEALRRGEARIFDVIKRLERKIYISVERIKGFDRELLTFFNVNSHEELRAAEKFLKTRGRG